MSISDEMMPAYFRLRTDLEEGEIESILAGHPLEAKKRLGGEIVTMYHSADDAQAARQRWEQVFSQRQMPDDIPTLEIAAESFNEADRLWLPRLLVLAGLASGPREARRFVEQGAGRVNGDKTTDVDAELALIGETIVQVGRRRFARVVRAE